MSSDLSLDTGALIALQRDRRRLLALVDLAYEQRRLLRTTAPVVTEFLGHSPRQLRAAGAYVMARVQTSDVTEALARRAAALIHQVLDAGGRAHPSAIDALLAAETEASAALLVFDGDRADFEALAGVAPGVEVRSLRDLV